MVFDALYRLDGQANQEIADAFDLAPSTVTQMVHDLSSRGLVESLEPAHYPADRKAGNRRKKALIRARAGYGVVATVDVTPEELSMAAVDFALEVRAPHAGSPAGPVADRESVVSRILSFCRSLDPDRLVGVGVSVSGTVDPTRNTLSTSIHLPDLVGDSFGNEVEETLGVPVVLVNDAHAIATGERYRGAGRDRESFVALYIADGAGAGIYTDGRLYRGWDNRAGELGSMVIDPGGDIGVSGRRGCFEDAVSRYALHRRMHELAARGVQSAAFADPRFDDPWNTFTVLRDYFEKNDSLVHTLVDGIADRIGLVAANVSAAFSPELIVLCGPLATLGEEFLALVRHALRRYAVSLPPGELDRHICLQPDVQRLKAIGAAKSAIDRHLALL